MWERRAAELTATGRTLTGTLVRYGDIGQGPSGAERFEAGAFGDIAGVDAILNLQHQRSRPLARTGGGLLLTDSAERLEIRAELPATRDGDDAAELVRTGVLRGLSAEFRALKERSEAGVRVIERAMLGGLGLVDSPAYGESRVELRQAVGGASATIPYRTNLACECHRGTPNTVRFERGAFSESLSSGRRIVAMGGDTKAQALAATDRGTLTLTEGREGLRVELAIPDTGFGRDIAALANATGLLARPLFDQDRSVFRERGGVAVYSQVWLRGILIGTTPADDGWPLLAVAQGAAT